MTPTKHTFIADLYDLVKSQKAKHYTSAKKAATDIYHLIEKYEVYSFLNGGYSDTYIQFNETETLKLHDDFTDTLLVKDLNTIIYYAITQKGKFTFYFACKTLDYLQEMLTDEFSYNYTKEINVHD